MSIETTNLGRLVVCDLCNEDWTDKPPADSAGFIVGSKAVCPTCAPRYRNLLFKYNELHLIKAGCADGQSFGDFVREYRGGDCIIQVITGDDAINELFGGAS
jgi:hypothetical protein